MLKSIQMENKKIVFVLPSLKTGGGNRVIIELANQLVFEDIAVDIIYPNNSLDVNTFTNSDKIRFFKIGKFSSNRLHKLKNIFSIFNFLNRRYENEIVIFTDPIMSIFIPLVRSNRSVRFVQADDYNIFNDLLILKKQSLLLTYKLLTKKSYNYNIEFIFNSKYTYDKFNEVSNRNNVGYKLVHPALDHTIFYNQNIRDPDELNICIIAREHPWKGFIDFIKPFNDGLIKKVNNVFVISHDDLTDFDLTNVTVISPSNDREIAHYMNLSHIFVSTSWWEGFGLPPIEAMACGCSVILSDAGGVNEYAEPSINCLMFEPKNQEELIQNINTLIDSPELRDRLAKNAMRTVKRFSWQNSKDQLLDVLEVK